MSIKVVPYTAEWVEGVRAFNARMHAGGTGWGWPATHIDPWLPDRDGHKTWREHWLAVEDGDAVRGAYAFKPHEWYIHGEPRIVTDWQGPVSEGLLTRRLSSLGMRLMREMLKQYPHLYSWGHGGLEQPMLLMLEKLKWLLHPTPFCVRVIQPVRFLRRNRYLRTTALRRLALDVAAFSGAGSIGLRALHALRSRRQFPGARAIGQPFATFGAWSDELWERCLPLYSAIALRDAATMNLLLAPDRWPPGIKLRVERDGAAIGWAVVMDTAMSDDERFGSLRVGSLVDCLAAPEDATAVVGVAFEFLRRRRVDLVVSNQAHPAWISAFSDHGFQILPNRRVFAASPELQKVLQPWPETSRGLHLTNMDGHGPMAL